MIASATAALLAVHSDVSLTKAAAVSPEGCTLAASGSVTESSSFTPYANQLTHMAPQPINPLQAPAASQVPFVRSGLGGLPLAWATAWPNGKSAGFYLDRPIDATMTIEDFYAADGVLLLTDPTDPGAGPYVAALRSQLGDRVTILKIAAFDAALTWADPVSNGIRPHYLTWSDGTTTFTLVANRQPDLLINVGRAMAC